jgi:raffinose/stachyose/melibiose transport system substrate-binding protein
MIHDHRYCDTFKPRHLVKAAAIVIAAGMAFSSAAVAQSLAVWDEYNFEAQSAVVNDLNKKFEAAHSGVTIQRTQRSFDDLSLTLRLAVSAGNGPVVTKVNQGAGDMGTMVKQKLLAPLDSYISSYGWDKRQSDSVLARDRWSDTGAFGEGPTYGISALAEIVGLYYNKKLLDEAGVKTPIATFEDFLAALDALKAKGIAPFMIGTAKTHMALHMIAAVSQAHIDASNRKELDDLIYGRGGTWKTPGNLASAKLVQDWANKGYFFDGHSGIGADDAVQLFIAGQGAFLISGTWYLGDMQHNPDIHFMAIPAPSGIKSPLSVGGIDTAWAITSLAKDQATKDLAASYIDYMVSEEAAIAWANAGYLPATALPEGAQVKMSPLLSEGVGMWKTLNANNAIGHYPDWASPTLLKTIDDNTPLLLANTQTPEEFIDAMEKDYQGYLKSK